MRGRAYADEFNAENPTRAARRTASCKARAGTRQQGQALAHTVDCGQTLRYRETIMSKHTNGPRGGPGGAASGAGGAAGESLVEAARHVVARREPHLRDTAKSWATLAGTAAVHDARVRAAVASAVGPLAGKIMRAVPQSVAMALRATGGKRRTRAERADAGSCTASDAQEALWHIGHAVSALLTGGGTGAAGDGGHAEALVLLAPPLTPRPEDLCECVAAVASATVDAAAGREPPLDLLTPHKGGANALLGLLGVLLSAARKVFVRAGNHRAVFAAVSAAPCISALLRLRHYATSSEGGGSVVSRQREALLSGVDGLLTVALFHDSHVGEIAAGCAWAPAFASAALGDAPSSKSRGGKKRGKSKGSSRVGPAAVLSFHRTLLESLQSMCSVAGSGESGADEACAAALHALPMMLAAVVRQLRRAERLSQSAAEGAAKSSAANGAGAPEDSGKTGTAGVGSPEFTVFVEFLLLAWPWLWREVRGDAPAARAGRSKAGTHGSGAAIVDVIDAAASAAAPEVDLLRCRVVAALVGVADRLELYRPNEDAAPHPQRACLSVLSAVAVTKLALDGTPIRDLDDHKSRIAVVAAIGEMYHALVEGHLPRIVTGLSKNVAQLSEHGDAADDVLQPALWQLKLLVSSFSRLRQLDTLMQAYFEALRKSVSTSAAPGQAAALDSMLRSPAHLSRLSDALRAAPAGQHARLWGALADEVTAMTSACSSGEAVGASLSSIGAALGSKLAPKRLEAEEAEPAAWSALQTLGVSCGSTALAGECARAEADGAKRRRKVPASDGRRGADHAPSEASTGPGLLACSALLSLLRSYAAVLPLGSHSAGPVAESARELGKDALSKLLNCASSIPDEDEPMCPACQARYSETVSCAVDLCSTLVGVYVDCAPHVVALSESGAAGGDLEAADGVGSSLAARVYAAPGTVDIGAMCDVIVAPLDIEEESVGAFAISKFLAAVSAGSAASNSKLSPSWCRFLSQRLQLIRGVWAGAAASVKESIPPDAAKLIGDMASALVSVPECRGEAAWAVEAVAAHAPRALHALVRSMVEQVEVHSGTGVEIASSALADAALYDVPGLAAAMSDVIVARLTHLQAAVAADTTRPAGARALKRSRKDTASAVEPASSDSRRLFSRCMNLAAALPVGALDETAIGKVTEVAAAVDRMSSMKLSAAGVPEFGSVHVMAACRGFLAKAAENCGPQFEEVLTHDDAESADADLLERRIAGVVQLTGNVADAKFPGHEGCIAALVDATVAMVSACARRWTTAILRSAQKSRSKAAASGGAPALPRGIPDALTHLSAAVECEKEQGALGLAATDAPGALSAAANLRFLLGFVVGVGEAVVECRSDGFKRSFLPPSVLGTVVTAFTISSSASTSDIEAFVAALRETHGHRGELARHVALLLAAAIRILSVVNRAAMKADASALASLTAALAAAVRGRDGVAILQDGSSLEVSSLLSASAAFVPDEALWETLLALGCLHTRPLQSTEGMERALSAVMEAATTEQLGHILDIAVTEARTIIKSFSRESELRDANVELAAAVSLVVARLVRVLCEAADKALVRSKGAELVAAAVALGVAADTATVGLVGEPRECALRCAYHACVAASTVVAQSHVVPLFGRSAAALLSATQPIVGAAARLGMGRPSRNVGRSGRLASRTDGGDGGGVLVALRELAKGSGLDVSSSIDIAAWFGAGPGASDGGDIVLADVDATVMRDASGRASNTRSGRQSRVADVPMTADGAVSPELFVAVCDLLRSFFVHRSTLVSACTAPLIHGVRGLLVVAGATRLSSLLDSSATGGRNDFDAQDIAAAAVLRLVRVCEELKRHSEIMRPHVVSLVSEHMHRLVDGLPPPRVRDALQPAVFSLLDILTAAEMQRLHTALAPGASGSSAARSLLRTLYDTYTRQHRFTGGV